MSYWTVPVKPINPDTLPSLDRLPYGARLAQCYRHVFHCSCTGVLCCNIEYGIVLNGRIRPYATGYGTGDYATLKAENALLLDLARRYGDLDLAWKYRT